MTRAPSVCPPKQQARRVVVTTALRVCQQTAGIDALSVFAPPETGSSRRSSAMSVPKKVGSTGRTLCFAPPPKQARGDDRAPCVPTNYRHRRDPCVCSKKTGSSRRSCYVCSKKIGSSGRSLCFAPPKQARGDDGASRVPTNYTYRRAPCVNQAGRDDRAMSFPKNRLVATIVGYVCSKKIGGGQAGA
jgi:hypothetical protein